MITRRNILLGALFTGVAATAGYITLRDDPGTAQYFATDGVALRGTDVVAYFTQGEAVAGSAAFAHDWAGVTWHFASAEHRDAFAADPETYAPQYGGYCAWAVAAKQQLFSTQPENWAVRDGKLYLNFNDAVQATWDEDPEGFIAQGDAAWPEVRKALG
ncbi:MAG: YHS domain-containing (seleno)protein [Pseudomonadota bacterium]